jgi:hypothetical protein
MRLQRLLGATVLATLAACAASGPSSEQVESAKARLDVAWLALAHTRDMAAERLDEDARSLCISRLMKLNDQLGYSGMLVVMSAAVPNLGDFEYAERAILRVEQEIARIDGEINGVAQVAAPGS